MISWSQGKGRPRTLREEGREQECVSQQLVWEQAVVFPKAICEALNLCLRKKRARQRDRSELLEKAGISLGAARAAERLSTSLLVLAAAHLWIWPQSGFLRPRFWKTWQEFSLKCGLWMALVWSKSEETVSSQPRSLSTWSPSRDSVTSLVGPYLKTVFRSWKIRGEPVSD